MGPGKHYFVKEMTPPGVLWDLCEGIGLYDAQEAFGKGPFLQTIPENNFLDFPGFRKRLGGAPGPLWCIPIVPL